MRTRTRSRWWFPGGGNHHPFIYRSSRSPRAKVDDSVVIDLRAVDLPGATRVERKRIDATFLAR